MKPPGSSRTGRPAIVRFAHRHGLTLVRLGLFLASLVGHAFCGYLVHIDELRRRGELQTSFWTYLRDAEFQESVSENWESEFLQMFAYVWLATFLFERGSPESKPVHAPHDETGR